MLRSAEAEAAEAARKAETVKVSAESNVDVNSSDKVQEGDAVD